MRSREIIIAGSIIILTLFARAADTKKKYPIKPVPFSEVYVTDEFWSRRIETNRTVTIPYALKQCEETGRVANFAIAAGMQEGKFCGYQFNDSDVFKVIEGASYSLAVKPDTVLRKYLDTLIIKIAKAQESDGYLYTARKLMDADYSPPGGAERWVGEKDGSHELYNAGHLYEAAVAHHLATGKDNLLDVAKDNADLVCKTFGPGGRHEVPGHQEIEIGLMKLYQLTGDEKYLVTAKYFLDERGDAKGHELIGEYSQDHLPVLQQTKAVGHAVRAMYMYSGMADVGAFSGNARYIAALDKLWTDVVGTKTYVTGGVGSTGANEGFGPAYDLPNGSAYCETCASIAFVFWNYRMFLLHGDAKYLDVLERTLYNSFLSGVGMSGDKFFYPNPLMAFHGKSRSPWFPCACCPSNVVRFMPAIPGYIYSQRADSIYVNLFIGSSANLELENGKVKIAQETNYPWDGDVKIAVTPDDPMEFALRVRIPGWSENEALPGNLYTFEDSTDEHATLTLNGKAVKLNRKDGFVTIRRTWTKGDTVLLSLPMPVRRVEADYHVADDRGRITLQRGPIVFCAEGKDNAGQVLPLVVSDAAEFTPEYRKDLLGGVEVIRTSAYSVRRTLNDRLALGPPQPFLAIPYFARAHRGESEMSVWLARESRTAFALPAPTLAALSAITTSGGKDSSAINDQFEPRNSNDQSVPYFHWWPKKGTREWVQYDFGRLRKLSGMKLYWFDDTGTGECRVPQSVQALYQVHGVWKPIPEVQVGVEKNKYNMISFPPLDADAVKIDVTLQPGFSAGIYEWILQ